MATHLRPIIAGVLTLAVFLSSPPRALSQEQGNLFGDLFEIKRDAATGQPILQKRWAELPGDEFG